jgi:hypothetical protein
MAMENHNKLFYYLIIGQVITFLSIAILQLTHNIGFLVMLLVMHGGIIILILVKKQLLKLNVNIKPYYKKMYLVLSLYLPLILYKIAARIFSFDYSKNIIYISTGLLFIVSFIYLLRSIKHLNTKFSNIKGT